MNVTFEDVLRMVADACQKIWFDGTYAKEKTVIECATKIYIDLKRQGRNDSNDKNET